MENHQDAASADLLALCRRFESRYLGITLDCGNPLAVMEEDGRGRAIDLEDVTRAAQVRFSLCDGDFGGWGWNTIFTAPRDPAVAACSMASR